MYLLFNDRLRRGRAVEDVSSSRSSRTSRVERLPEKVELYSSSAGT